LNFKGVTKVYKLYKPYKDMKNKTPKIKENDVVVKKYSIWCPICDKEIKGNSPTQIEYALSNHIKFKHPSEKIK